MICTLVCDVLGDENNGTTIAAMNLMRTLRAKGHTVRVLCPDKSRIGQPDFYVVPTFNLGPLNGYVAKNGVTLAKPDKRIVKQAVAGADVVHVMIPFALGRAAEKQARRLGIPVTAGFHCQAENFTNHIFLMNCGLANKLCYKVFYHTLYKRCAAVHYPTRFICDLFEKAAGPTNHYVISNGVSKQFKPPMQYKQPGEEFVIVFTGRYSKEKSHRVLIDGVARSAYKNRIKLVFAGSGPQEKKLKKYAKKRLPVQPEFGFYSRERLIDILHGADLYVHPAEIEIEAIACLEAIACGLVPVISNSRRSATRYFAIDENNLFECNNPSSLAKKIDWWIEHPQQKQQRSAQYGDYSAQFDFDTCMDNMEQMLLTACKKQA